MDMIDRYVFAVTKRLPPKQRADIEKELRSLIDDMLAARTKGAQATQADIEAVLTEIGEPQKVAANYLGAKQYLISPELYGAYTIVLRVVLACVAFGVTIAMIVSAISNPAGMLGTFASYLATLFNTLLSAFAFITIAFAIIDRVRDTSEQGKDIADKIQAGFAKGAEEVRRSFEHNNKHHHTHHHEHSEPWRPADLPHVPREDVYIRSSEPIAGIALTCVWLAIVNFAPWIIGIYVVHPGQYSITPFFNLEVLKTYLVYINALGILMILIHVGQLFTGRWNIPIALAKIVHNVFSALLFINMFTDPNLFDRAFFSRTAELFHFQGSASSVMTMMDSVFFQVFFFVVLFGLAIDCITTLVKGIRGAMR